jgi:hypothetical protein
MTIITTSASRTISSASKPLLNVLTQDSVLAMLSNIQDNLNEYQARVLEMEQELSIVKLENNLLRNQIRVLTTMK